MITPEKIQEDVLMEPEDQKKTILNLVKIIGEVAASINIDIAQEDLTAMEKWDICALRKKLGDFNKKKMLLNSPPAAKFDHGQKHQNMFSNPNQEIYDDQGLNVAAVSTDTQPSEKVLKTKPPMVTSVLKKNSKNKSQVRHSYTARLRLTLSKFDSVNVGFVLRQMFQLWKDADSSIILLAHNDEENADMWIDDVQKIPDEQNLVDKYVAGLYQYNEKLHFSLRFSGHQDLKKMKLKIFAWMKSNDSFVTIDKVKAALVHTIGFFYKIHPDFFNREILKQDVMKHLEKLNLGDDVNVFPRKLWIRTNEGRVETRALAIEVPKKDKDVINRHMMKYSYEGCAELMYVPFSNMKDEVYKQTLKEIFYGQNIYLHTTHRRTIYGIQNALEIYPTKGGKSTSFVKWIQSVTYGDATFLDACEVGPTGNIHLIYNKEYDQTVQKLFGQGFKAFAMENFNGDAITNIFTAEKVQLEEGNFKTQDDLDYAEMLKRKFSNPQDPMQSTTKISETKSYAEASRGPPAKLTRVNLHYSKFSRPTTLRTNTYQNSSGHVSTGTMQTEQGPSEVSGEKNSLAWMKSLEDRLAKKIDDYRKDFDQKLVDLEKQTQDRMEKSEGMILNRLQEMQMKTTEEIKLSFNEKMNNVDQKFHMIMTMLSKQPTGSTGPNNTTESVNGPGKGQ